MRVLVACEFSGIVREAFRARGHSAMSADLEPSEIQGWHYRGDVRKVLSGGWDLMIAFPPCTHLCRSGAGYHYGTPEMFDALSFVSHLMQAPVPRIAVENPIGAISSHLRKPDQIIQPWQFGHDTTKATCLWLKGLPPLEPTDVLTGPFDSEVMSVPERSARWRDRSRTYAGIAAAMAEQWGV